MGESAVTPTYQPTFQRANVTLKVVRRKGATTDFLQDASKKNIDAAATNIEACLIAHTHDLENYLLYGNAGSNVYEFTGLDRFVVTNRTNEVVGGTVPTNLQFLDNMIDKNLDLQGINHKKAFVMSPYMLSKVSQLLTNVRLNQGLQGAMTQVDIAGGWRMNAYRDIPIIVSSSCRPKATCSTPVASQTDTGGSIAANATYYVRISAVTKDGETLASPEVTCTAGAAGPATHTLILTFTAVAGAYRYKVYAGTVAGTLLLTKIVPAFTYDANGTLSVSETDVITAGVTSVTSDATGAVTVINLLNAPSTIDTTTVPTNMGADLPLTGALANPPEYIFMWDLDEFQGLGRLAYTNEGGSRFNGLVTIEDLAKTDDFLPFLIKTYAALADSYESTSCIHRGLRVS